MLKQLANNHGKKATFHIWFIEMNERIFFCKSPTGKNAFWSRTQSTKFVQVAIQANLRFEILHFSPSGKSIISNKTDSQTLYLTSRTFRHSSLDGLTNGRGTSLSGGLFSRPKPSSSESNLRKLALGDFVARPGSALGLLQGKMRERRPARRLFFLLCQLFWPEHFLCLFIKISSHWIGSKKTSNSFVFLFYSN